MYWRSSSMTKVLPMGNYFTIPPGHLPLGNIGDTAGMAAKSPQKLYKIRRQRLLQLLSEVGGKQAQLLELLSPLNESQSYLSRMLSGKKKIGEEKARSIETAAKKPPRWMDGEDSPGTKPQPATAAVFWPFSFQPEDFAERWTELTVGQRMRIEGEIMMMMETFEREIEPTPHTMEARRGLQRRGSGSAP